MLEMTTKNDDSRARTSKMISAAGGLVEDPSPEVFATGMVRADRCADRVTNRRFGGRIPPAAELV